MATVAPARVPTPRLKTPPTASTTAESVTTTSMDARASASISAPSGPRVTFAADAPLANQPPSPPPGPPPPGPPPLSRRPARATAPDPLSEKATLFLIRRTLCSQQLDDKNRATPAPIEELLPSLTSRNDIDLQLYAIIAILLREFVQKWYTKITPDETFVAEIVQTIAHCTRALEQRLRKVDLESLLFDEIPELLDKHVTAYRAAHSAVVRPPVEADPREIYHSLCPLPLLSPVPKEITPSSVEEQARNEMAYRQLLVQGVLALLLPTEDLENDCLTALVGQLFSELIIGGVIANKASEPWLIWEGLAILTRVFRKKPAAHDSNMDPTLESNDIHPVKRHAERRRGPFSINRILGSIMQWFVLAGSAIRLLAATLAMSRSLPPRSQGLIGHEAKLMHHKDGPRSTKPPNAEAAEEPAKSPVLGFGLWSCVANLLEMDARMPWLSGTLSMMQWIAMNGPGQTAGLDGHIDRLLSHLIQKHVLDPGGLPPLLRTLRGALFPNNAMGKPTMVAPSSDAELLAVRRKCASALWALLPRGVGRLYFGPGPGGAGGSGDGLVPSSSPLSSSRTGPSNGERIDQFNEGRLGSEESDLHQEDHTSASDSSLGISVSRDGSDRSVEDDRIISEIETGILDVFGDAYCNKHLMYSILELILARLMPELTEKGITELWEERLS